MNLVKGAGGCREAAVSGDAHGAGNHCAEGQADVSRGASEGTRGFQGELAPDDLEDRNYKHSASPSLMLEKSLKKG